MDESLDSSNGEMDKKLTVHDIFAYDSRGMVNQDRYFNSDDIVRQFVKELDNSVVGDS